MSKTIEISRARLESWYRQMRDLGLQKLPHEIMEHLAAPVVERQPVAWVIMRNGSPDYDRDVVISNTAGDTLGDGDEWMQVYTGSDNAEVEYFERIAELRHEALLKSWKELEDLKSGPPMPIAVALPDRKHHVHLGLSHTDARTDGWNACLDKVKELNQ